MKNSLKNLSLVLAFLLAMNFIVPNIGLAKNSYANNKEETEANKEETKVNEEKTEDNKEETEVNEEETEVSEEETEVSEEETEVNEEETEVNEEETEVNEEETEVNEEETEVNEEETEDNGKNFLSRDEYIKFFEGSSLEVGGKSIEDLELKMNYDDKYIYIYDINIHEDASGNTTEFDFFRYLYSGSFVEDFEQVGIVFEMERPMNEVIDKEDYTIYLGENSKIEELIFKDKSLYGLESIQLKKVDYKKEATVNKLVLDISALNMEDGKRVLPFKSIIGSAEEVRLTNEERIDFHVPSEVDYYGKSGRQNDIKIYESTKKLIIDDGVFGKSSGEFNLSYDELNRKDDLEISVGIQELFEQDLEVLNLPNGEWPKVNVVIDFNGNSIKHTKSMNRFGLGVRSTIDSDKRLTYRNIASFEAKELYLKGGVFENIGELISREGESYTGFSIGYYVNDSTAGTVLKDVKKIKAADMTISNTIFKGDRPNFEIYMEDGITPSFGHNSLSKEVYNNTSGYNVNIYNPKKVDNKAGVYLSGNLYTNDPDINGVMYSNITIEGHDDIDMNNLEISGVNIENIEIKGFSNIKSVDIRNIDRVSNVSFNDISGSVDEVRMISIMNYDRALNDSNARIDNYIIRGTYMDGLDKGNIIGNNVSNLGKVEVLSDPTSSLIEPLIGDNNNIGELNLANKEPTNQLGTLEKPILGKNNKVDRIDVRVGNIELEKGSALLGEKLQSKDVSIMTGKFNGSLAKNLENTKESNIWVSSNEPLELTEHKLFLGDENKIDGVVDLRSLPLSVNQENLDKKLLFDGGASSETGELSLKIVDSLENLSFGDEIFNNIFNYDLSINSKALKKKLSFGSENIDSYANIDIYGEVGKIDFEDNFATGGKQVQIKSYNSGYKDVYYGKNAFKNNEFVNIIMNYSDIEYSESSFEKIDNLHFKGSIYNSGDIIVQDGKDNGKKEFIYPKNVFKNTLIYTEIPFINSKSIIVGESGFENTKIGIRSFNNVSINSEEIGDRAFKNVTLKNVITNPILTFEKIKEISDGDISFNFDENENYYHDVIFDVSVDGNEDVTGIVGEKIVNSIKDYENVSEVQLFTRDNFKELNTSDAVVYGMKGLDVDFKDSRNIRTHSSLADGVKILDINNLIYDKTNKSLSIMSDLEYDLETMIVFRLSKGNFTKEAAVDIYKKIDEMGIIVFQDETDEYYEIIIDKPEVGKVIEIKDIDITDIDIMTAFYKTELLRSISPFHDFEEEDRIYYVDQGYKNKDDLIKMTVSHKLDGNVIELDDKKYESISFLNKRVNESVEFKKEDFIKDINKILATETHELIDINGEDPASILIFSLGEDINIDINYKSVKKPIDVMFSHYGYVDGYYQNVYETEYASLAEGSHVDIHKYIKTGKGLHGNEYVYDSHWPGNLVVSQDNRYFEINYNKIKTYPINIKYIDQDGHSINDSKDDYTINRKEGYSADTRQFIKIFDEYEFKSISMDRIENLSEETDLIIQYNKIEDESITGIVKYVDADTGKYINDGLYNRKIYLKMGHSWENKLYIREISNYDFIESTLKDGSILNDDFQVELRYKKEDDIRIKLNYVDQDGNSIDKNLNEEIMVEKNSIFKPDKYIKEIEGYSYLGNVNIDPVIVTEDKVIDYEYAKLDDKQYKVNIKYVGGYNQSIDNGKYDLEFEMKSGSELNLKNYARKIHGYKGLYAFEIKDLFENYDGTKDKKIEIQSDTIISMYYDKYENPNAYLVEVKHYEDKDLYVEPLADGIYDTNFYAKEGTDIDAEDYVLELEEYEIKKIDNSKIESISKDEVINMLYDEYGNVIVVDEYNYKVIYKDTDGKILDIEEGKYFEGKDFKAEIKKFDGYEFKESHPDNATVTINSDESLNIIEIVYAKIDKPTEPGRPIGPGKPIGPDKPVEPESHKEIEKEEGIINQELNVKDHMEYIQGYPDGELKPENNISREEVASIFYRILNPNYREKIYMKESSFEDIPASRWSQKHIGTLNNAGILKGYEDGSFKYSRDITRAEAAAIVARYTSENYDGDNLFNDIDGHWAKEYINQVADSGWIKGYKDGSFRPNENITRAELVSIVNNLLSRTVKKSNILEGIKFYPDLDSDKWYYEAMVEATNGHNYIKDENDDEIWTELIEVEVEM